MPTRKFNRLISENFGTQQRQHILVQVTLVLFEVRQEQTIRKRHGLSLIDYCCNDNQDNLRFIESCSWK